MSRAAKARNVVVILMFLFANQDSHKREDDRTHASLSALGRGALQVALVEHVRTHHIPNVLCTVRYTYTRMPEQQFSDVRLTAVNAPGGEKI